MADYKLRIVLELDGREVLVEEATLADLWSLPVELGNPGALGFTGRRFMERAIAVSAEALDKASSSRLSAIERARDADA